MRKFLAPYFSPKGRSSRREWWIIEILILFGFRLNERVFETMARGGGRFDMGEEAGQTWMILAVTLLWLNIASNVRRLHDRGKSGWWSLIYLIPGIGQLWCFIECGFLKGQPHANRYGAPPGAVDVYGALATKIRTCLRAPAPKSGSVQMPAPAPSPAEITRPARSRPIVSRPSAVTRNAPPSRKLGVALAVGAALLLGLATLAFTIGIPIPVAVVPVEVNQNLPVFESIDKTLKP